MKWSLLLCCLTSGLVAADEQYQLRNYENHVPAAQADRYQISIDLGLCNVHVSADETEIPYRVTGEYWIGEPELTWQLQDEVLHVQFTHLQNKEDQEGSLFRRGIAADSSDLLQQWNIHLNPQILTDLDLTIGIGKLSADLGGMMLDTLVIANGLSEADVRFSQSLSGALSRADFATGLGDIILRDLDRAPFQQINLDCGLGSAEMYYGPVSIMQQQLHLSVGFGSVDIYLDPAIGVELAYTPSLFSDIDLSSFQCLKPDLYHSENWKYAGSRIRCSLDLGMGSVDFHNVVTTP